MLSRDVSGRGQPRPAHAPARAPTFCRQLLSSSWYVCVCSAKVFRILAQLFFNMSQETDFVYSLVLLTYLNWFLIVFHRFESDCYDLFLMPLLGKMKQFGFSLAYENILNYTYLKADTHFNNCQRIFAVQRQIIILISSLSSELKVRMGTILR